MELLACYSGILSLDGMLTERKIRRKTEGEDSKITMVLV